MSDQANEATRQRRGRQTPRPFAFHWGSGNIVEEASFRGQYVEPCVQLLEYEDHPGSSAYGSATTASKAASSAAR